LRWKRVMPSLTRFVMLSVDWSFPLNLWISLHAWSSRHRLSRSWEYRIRSSTSRGLFLMMVTASFQEEQIEKLSFWTRSCWFDPWRKNKAQ
jgi:hypothetical protein